MVIWTMFIFVAICLITDLSERKIYNVVVLAGLITALTLNVWEQGLAAGVQNTFSGFFAGILLLLVPFILGGIGAGDVKMLGMVGAFLGSSLVFHVMLASALAGGVFAIFVMLREGNFIGRLKNMFFALYCTLAVRKAVHLQTLQDPQAQSRAIPYGAAITTGVIIVYIMGSMNHALSLLVIA